MPSVEGFLPSTSGLHFPNRFDHVPLRTVRVPLLGMNVTLGDAANGLCGGMVFAVRDYHESRLPPPTLTTAPNGGPLYDYLVQRLFDSWDIPGGIIRYLELMNPRLPDTGSVSGPLGLVTSSRSAIMIQEEWPRVRQDLDDGRLCPLGLIELKSADPARLGQNHQVLAYGYDLQGTNLTLNLYDPNAPDNDGVVLTASLADPEQSCQLTCTTVPTVFCFFRSNYAPALPPRLDSPSG